MGRMGQREVFSLLNDRKSCVYRSADELVDLLGECMSISINTTRVSELKNGKREYTRDVYDIDKMYDVLFSQDADGSAGSEAAKLDALMRYIGAKGWEFPGSQGMNGDSYERYVRRMLDHALWPEPEKDNSAADRKEFSGQLRSQNFSEKKCFLGRESILAEMEDHLRDDHIVVLSGLGGIGKSYLSEEYAIRHEDSYDLRQQLKFSEDNQLRSFRDLIMRLKFDGLNEKDLSDNERYEMRLERLMKAGERTLLLLDSVDTRWDAVGERDGVNVLEDFIKDAGSTCPHIIITTRLTAEFNDLFPVIKVEPLAEEEQLELFERHLGYPVDESDKAQAQELFQYVGGHTLLIELCAKSIREGELDFDEMKECLMGKGGDEPAIVFQKDGRHQTTISSFVRNILFRIDLPEDEIAVLRQTALLPAEGISRKLFLRELCSPGANPLVTLERKGWIEAPIRDKERITRLHPVIREVVKQTLKPSYDNCSTFFDDLSNSFIKCSEGHTLKPAYERDLCRLCRSLSDSDVFGQPAEEKVAFLRRMAAFYQDEREYDYLTIAKIYMLLLSLLEERSPVPADQCVRTCLEIGKAYQQLGKYSDAIRFFQKAEPYARDDRSLLGQVYQKLGDVSRKASEYEQARKYFERTLELAEDNYDMALAKNAFGVLCGNEGKHEQALSLYEEAQKLWEGYIGKSESELPEELREGRLAKQLAYVTHNIGTAWHNIGKKQRDKNKIYKAKECHEQAKHIREENDFDEKERDMTASYAWLGNDLLELAKLERDEGHEDKFAEYMQQAKGYIDQSFEARKDIVGESHQDFAWPLKNLSDWYETMGDIPSALAQMEKVIEIRQKTLGERHEYTKQAVKRKEQLLKQLG